MRSTKLKVTFRNGDLESTSKHEQYQTIGQEGVIKHYKSSNIRKLEELSTKKSKTVLLCQTISYAIKTVSEGLSSPSNECKQQDMFLIQQVFATDFSKSVLQIL